MTQIDLRPANINHAEDIWGIIRSSFIGSHSPYVATGQPQYEQYLRDRLNGRIRENRKIFVAYVDGQFSAFADVTFNDGRPNFLTRIGVDYKFRGRGIARLLMGEISASRGENTTWELDVLDSNTSALHFYKANGFVVTSSKQWIGKEIDTFFYGKKALAVDEHYARYGFTMATVKDQRIAIAGSAVRCQTLNQFQDSDFLQEVRYNFPLVDRAFIIIDPRDSGLKALSNTFTITRSYRMLGVFK